MISTSERSASQKIPEINLVSGRGTGIQCGEEQQWARLLYDALCIYSGTRLAADTGAPTCFSPNTYAPEKLAAQLLYARMCRGACLKSG